MPATVIAERVEWGGSITWFRENLRRLRPTHRPVDPADRLSWVAADAEQCDLWFPPRKIPLEDGPSVLLPVLVIVAAHSRFSTARMIPTRKTQDLLLGSRAVPRRLIWDNEPGIGQKGRLAQSVAAFAGTLATKVVQLRPYDPESKGKPAAVATRRAAGRYVVFRARRYFRTLPVPVVGSASASKRLHRAHRYAA